MTELIGGHACLDFANTVGPRLPRAGTASRDTVGDYAALVAWSAHAGLLTAEQKRHLTAAADADPGPAADVHAAALRLREAIYQAFDALAQDEQAPSDALTVLRDAYRNALRWADLDSVTDGLAWRWPDRGPVEQVLWPIARSAVDLAVSGPITRVKRCPGDDGQCGWLFVDTSKNGARRWCSMATCGSRVKSRRQAARLRAARD